VTRYATKTPEAKFLPISHSCSTETHVIEHDRSDRLQNAKRCYLTGGQEMTLHQQGDLNRGRKRRSLPVSGRTQLFGERKWQLYKGRSDSANVITHKVTLDTLKGRTYM